MTMITDDDSIELLPISRVNLSLSLMAKPKVIDSNLTLGPKVREEPFNVNI